MKWSSLSVIALLFALFAASAAPFARAENESLPILRLAFFKTQLPPDLADFEIHPEYYFWLCVDEAEGWDHEFLISYELNNPHMILSNTWSPGFRYEHGWYQKIHIDSAFLEHGKVNLDLILESESNNDTWVAGIDIAEFLSHEGVEKYTATSDDTFFSASSPCGNAVPLEDRHVKRSQGEKIH